MDHDWVTDSFTTGIGSLRRIKQHFGRKRRNKTVGVLQLVEHGSLNAAYEGFKEGLAEAGYTEGENLTIEYQNAQNSQDNLKV